MPDNMLHRSLQSQCQRAFKFKCSEQLQPGYSKRPNIQLGQEQLPQFHGTAKIPPINKPVGILQVNNPMGISPALIGISSNGPLQRCHSESQPRTRNYVFKRSNESPAPTNQFLATNSSTGNRPSACSSVVSENCKFSKQLSSTSFVNDNIHTTAGSSFAISSSAGLVFVQIGLESEKPPLSFSSQPQTGIAHSHANSQTLLPINPMICSDVITGEQRKVSNTIPYKLMPLPTAVGCQPGYNKLTAPDQCSNNNPSINPKLDHRFRKPLTKEVSKPYIFKKIGPIPHSGYVMHQTDVKANLSLTITNTMLQNGTNFIPSSASVALKPHQINITEAQQTCSQVSAFSSSIADCYVELDSSVLPNKVLGQKIISNDNSAQMKSQVHTTIATKSPLLLNILSTEGGIVNGPVESSLNEPYRSKTSSYKSTMSTSGTSNDVGLPGVSEQKNVPCIDLSAPTVTPGGACPKIPKKSAVSKKRQKKPPKSVNEATVSTNQGECAIDIEVTVGADAGRVTTDSSKAVKEEETSSTIKKGATRKRAPKKTQTKASCATKDSTSSDVASDSPCTTASKTGSFTSDAPEVETDPLLVYFDLETTGLSYSHEITQISCVCPDVSDGGEFNVYTLPKGSFQSMASAITGLTKRGQLLYLHGKKVSTISLQEGLSQLIKWLEALPRRPLLVGHNSRRFDCPRLALALWNHNSLDTIHKSICGFSDSLPVLRTLLPSRGEYKLESLLHQYCPNSTESSHNALDDCRALHSVLQEVVRVSTATPVKTSASDMGGATSTSVSATISSTQTADPSTSMAVASTPPPTAAAAFTVSSPTAAPTLASVTKNNTTVSTAQVVNVAAGIGKPKEKFSEGDETKLFATMVSDFEQDLIREALNECILKEYFSVQQVLDSIKRSAPAKAVMKVGGS